MGWVKSNPEHKGMKTEGAIREACRMRYRGMSYRKIGDALGFSGRTIRRWQEGEEIWADELRLLQNREKSERTVVLKSQWDVVSDAQKKLADFSVANLQCAIDAQKEVKKQLENIQLADGAIKTIEDLELATRALMNLTRLMDSSWESFETAIELEQFLHHNQQAPEIEFQEYTDVEIAAIRAGEDSGDTAS